MTQTLTSPGGGSLAIAGGRKAGLQPPALAPHGSEPPGDSPGTPFSTVLDDHQARTAVAEGHQQKREDAARRAAADRREHAIERDGDDAGKVPVDSTTSPEASALAALLGGAPLPAGVKLSAVAIAATPQGNAAATAGSPAGAPGGMPGLPASAGAATTPMPTGPSMPAAATALPLRPPLPAAIGAEATLATTPATGPEQPMQAATAAARATRLADVLQAATARAAATGSVATPTPAAAAIPSAATIAGARASGQGPDQAATGAAASQSAAPAPMQPAVLAPAQGGTPSAAVAPTPGVGLEHAVETVRLALRAAADRGVTHARISLAPRELGSIEVHLRQTADGLVARVVAEHATAAQLLQHAGADLRRSLESQGIALLRLDIGASGEQGGRARLSGGSAFGDDGARRRDRGGDADALASLDGPADPTSTTTTIALANGALVDVLA
jgi:flagellar hook-length control protein FliK